MAIDLVTVGPGDADPKVYRFIGKVEAGFVGYTVSASVVIDETDLLGKHPVKNSQRAPASWSVEAGFVGYTGSTSWIEAQAPHSKEEQLVRCHLYSQQETQERAAKRALKAQLKASRR